MKTTRTLMPRTGLRCVFCRHQGPDVVADPNAAGGYVDNRFVRRYDPHCRDAAACWSRWRGDRKMPHAQAAKQSA